jgi:hypothetical protein
VAGTRRGVVVVKYSLAMEIVMTDTVLVCAVNLLGAVTETVTSY